MTKKINLTVDFVKSILDYDPDTGIFRWRYRNDRARNWNTRRAGTIAGYSDPFGYVSIRIEGEGLYLAQRLAWLIMTGVWPEECDHRNGDPADNRFSNLRECTHAENLRNKAKQSNNTSGYTGIRYRPHHRKWEGRITVNRICVWREYFADPREAAAARRIALDSLHGEFAKDHYPPL